MQNTSEPHILAIIPARGGSKGILRKNVRLLAGKPLVAHTLESALTAKWVTRVVVSTDDPEIGSIVQKFGGEVVWRPPEISGDAASSESALLHTLEHLKQTEGYQPEIVAFLQCTSPLTSPEDIDGTIEALLEAEADSALAATPFHYFLWRQESDGDAVGINHSKSIRPLRQEREPQYLETGGVYVFRTQGFLLSRHRFFGKTALYVVPPERRLEIDEMIDFHLAEVMLREHRQQHRLLTLPQPVTALVLDFDGVFTDNKVMVHQNGQESVICDRSDGWGLARVKELGIPILVLSTETNPVVKARCDKLGIQCLHGFQNKLPELRKWLRENKLEANHVIYVGNDVNDLACLQAVGCGIVVNDAHPDVRAAAHLILSARGGQGAIREVCDLILQSRHR